MTIIGKAMISTKFRASKKGLEMKRIIAICPASTRAVRIKIPILLIFPDLKCREKAAPTIPSINVEIAQEMAVKPPISNKYL